MKRIQSKLHRTETYVCKIYLSSFDDKKHILDDGIKILAHFHKDKRSQKKLGKIGRINGINRISRHCTKVEVFRRRLRTTTCRQLDTILKFLGKLETDNFTPCLMISNRFVHVFRNRFLQDNMMFSRRKTSSTRGFP